MMMQLPLGLQLLDEATFKNYCVGSNQQVVTYLKTMLANQSEKYAYIFGPSGLGKSHLLQACCHQANENNKTSVYLPLTNKQFSPQILEGLENLDLICLDDLQTIAGNLAWEEALFHCYNRVAMSQSRLIIAANLPPKSLNLKLPDLISRLSASVIFQLQLLTDEQKIIALRLRANAKGMELSDEVGHYLLRHCPRDMTALFHLLDKLDHASLAAQRKLTIPFIKMLLI